MDIDKKTKKTIIVTGGAGFIGSHLCERLVKDGHRVISLDNYFTGSKENHIDGVEYIEGHTKDIDKSIKEKPDLIYHLGEYSRIEKSLSEPEMVWDLNIQGSLAVFEFWRKHKCKLVYAGSSSKFADERPDKVEGRDRSPYSWGKAAMSELVHNYGRWYDLPYSISYFYSVYGPGERGGWHENRYGTVVETLKQCYLAGEACKINGTGEQTRTFTHIEDTIDALILIGEKGVEDEYVISAKEVYSLLDLAKMYELEIEFLPATKSTRSAGTQDTTKLESLGWKQKRTLKEYIEGTKKEAKK